MTIAISDWARALDELESSVIVAEQTLLTGATLTDQTSWEPPRGLGPLPAELVDRARALADRQQRVLAELSPALARLRQRSQLTRKISDATGQRRPSVYIDQRA